MLCMALKALLCSGDDELPQHQSVLRAIYTLNSPQNYIRLLGALLPILGAALENFEINKFH
jgi:hypothetical protein